VIPGEIFDVRANNGHWAMMALGITGESPLHCFEVVPATSSAKASDRKPRECEVE
jgi:hypothetical protein